MPFVETRGRYLILNNSTFQFIGFNIPNFAVQDDPWQRTNAYEQEDILGSLSQMGASATRSYTFSFPSISSDTSKHIIVTSGFGTDAAEWVLNEALFRDFDRGLKLARDYNVRIIIPFIDYWDWWGGIKAFCGIFGKEKNQFWTDQLIRDQFQSFLRQVINRNNTVTGISYRDEEMILGWETGNELLAPSAWTIEIARYIKILDPNHLVIDGNYGSWYPEVLSSPFIDVFTNHYYPPSFTIQNYTTAEITLGSLSFLSSVVLLSTIIIGYKRKSNWYIKMTSNEPFVGHKVLSRKACFWATVSIIFIGLITLMAFMIMNPMLGRGLDFKSRILADSLKFADKPFFVGEYGLAPFKTLASVLDYFPNEKDNVAGILIWALRGHSKDGGFYTHPEGNNYYAYHYPGFPSGNGFPADEIDIMSATQKGIARIQSIRNNSIPNPPNSLSVKRITGEEIEMSWQGCMGCFSYSLQVNNKTIRDGILDNYPSGKFTVKIPATSGSLSITGHGRWGNISSFATNV
jgi:hypothetical protein